MGKTTNFKKPTVDGVDEFYQERKNTINPYEFYDNISNDNKFIRHCLSLKITPSQINSMNISCDENKTYFWYRDKDGNCLNAKVIIFKEDGHRNKEIHPYWKESFNDTNRVSFFNEDKINDNDSIIIVESEKTAVIMESIAPEFTWLALGAATMFKEKNYDLLLDKDAIIIPDMDFAGYRTGVAISEIMDKHNIRYSILDLKDLIDKCCENPHLIRPEIAQGFDIADFADCNKADEDISYFSAAVVDSLKSVVKANKRIRRGTEIIGADEWDDMIDEKEEYLIDTIFQRAGTGGIVGMPDSGKTQLMKFISLAIIYGAEKFLEFELKPKHGKVLFVSTEDNPEALLSSLKKQNAYFMQKTNKENLLKNFKPFFADTLSNDEVLAKIKDFLRFDKIDLLVVDSFGDLFPGTDYNNATQVRNYLRKYSGLSQKFGYLTIFIHHVTKSSYNKEASQEYVLGSSSIVQKMRFVMDMRPNKNNLNKKYLIFVKGNYIPSKLKQEAYVMEMDEENLTFKYNNEKIRISDMNREFAEENRNRVDWNEVFKGKEVIITDEISVKLSQLYGLSVNTASRNIKKAIAKGLIVKIGYGKYKLADEKNK